MDFKDNVLQLAERIKKQKDAIQTEEATKNAFIMPIITALGYITRRVQTCWLTTPWILLREHHQ